MSDHRIDGAADRERRSTVELCATCGDAIDTSEWHPVATVTDADGDVRIYPFCDEACRDAWDGD